MPLFYEEACSITATAHTELWHEPWPGWALGVDHDTINQTSDILVGGTGGTEIVRKGLLNTHFSSSTWAETWMPLGPVHSYPCGEGRDEQLPGFPPVWRSSGTRCLSCWNLLSHILGWREGLTSDLMTFLTVAVSRISRVFLKSGSRRQCTPQKTVSVLAVALPGVGARRETCEAISRLHLS